MWLRCLVSGFHHFLFVQEVVDAALLEKVKTSIQRSNSLQMLHIVSVHYDMVEAVLKGACGNTSLKKLVIRLLSEHWQQHLKAATAELQQIRPQLELDVR